MTILNEKKSDYFLAEASGPFHAFRCSLVRLMKFWLWSRLFAECIVDEFRWGAL